MDMDEYASRQRHTPATYEAEPVQQQRLNVMASRCVGTVLDVGASDGYSASLMREAGHDVHVVDIAQLRLDRAKEDYDLDGTLADASALPFEDRSFDTVVLGEILEHMDNPGAAFSEACRVARQRVIVSVPLNGWEDPTHVWRVSLDQCHDHRETNRTKQDQIVVSFQRGRCWPPNYWQNDPMWQNQFEED